MSFREFFEGIVVGVMAALLGVFALAWGLALLALPFLAIGFGLGGAAWLFCLAAPFC